MKYRIAMWASAGFLVACCWALYFAMRSKENPIEPIVYSRLFNSASCAYRFLFPFRHVFLFGYSHECRYLCAGRSDPGNTAAKTASRIAQRSSICEIETAALTDRISATSVP